MTFAVLKSVGKAPVESERLKVSGSSEEKSFFKSFIIFVQKYGKVQLIFFEPKERIMLKISSLVAGDVKMYLNCCAFEMSEKQFCFNLAFSYNKVEEVMKMVAIFVGSVIYSPFCTALL